LRAERDEFVHDAAATPVLYQTHEINHFTAGVGDGRNAFLQVDMMSQLSFLTVRYHALTGQCVAEQC